MRAVYIETSVVSYLTVDAREGFTRRGLENACSTIALIFRDMIKKIEAYESTIACMHKSSR